MDERRFTADQIRECEASSETSYIIELRDGRILKLRRSQLNEAEIKELAAFFLR